MRRFGVVLTIGWMMALPVAASATVYTFQDMETSALSPLPVSFSFSLDTALAEVTNGNDATFSNVAITQNGTTVAGNTVGASFGTNLSSPLFFLIDTSTTPFYSGLGTGIVFNTGSFAIADGATDGEGTLTISSDAVAPTPEPATWALLLTGCALTVVAGSRTRRFAAGSVAAL